MQRIIYSLCFLFAFGQTTWSQNDRLFTMFVFNKLQYNPGYAGSAEALNVGVHYRHQWQGIEGAPRTVTAFGHAPIAGGRSGVGLSLISDDIGIFNSTYAKMAYAYRIPLKNKATLSFGINAQYDFTRFDWTKATLIDNLDALVPFGEPSSNTFNFGAGLYYEAEKFYVGASVPSILRNAITSEAYRGFGDLNELRTHYLMGGLIIPVSNNVHLRPSLLVSYVDNAPLDIDFNLSVLFLESLWIGASYRLEESLDAFVQFPVNQQLKVAVGVDYALKEINDYTRGSFEVMIEYLFKYDNGRINNIRFF
ncbi:MAG: type IX secretion system membrane protein PorP/SprF [Bacteroidota bacterium]